MGRAGAGTRTGAGGTEAARHGFSIGIVLAFQYSLKILKVGNVIYSGSAIPAPPPVEKSVPI